MRLVSNPEQLIRPLRFAAQMRFLSSAKHHDLVETDGLRMFEPEDTNPIKLACKETCTRSDCGSRNHKHQHALAGHPAITVLQKYQLHSLITVQPKLAVVRRIQVQERACFRQ